MILLVNGEPLGIERVNSNFLLKSSFRQRLKLQHQQAIMHKEHQTMVKAVGRFMAVCISLSLPALFQLVTK